MDTPSTLEVRFGAYLHALAAVVLHQDRVEPLVAYVCGLALPGERKSVEPIAARIDPGRVSARHQSLSHFVGQASWSDKAVLAVARDYALSELQSHGSITHWLVDDTGFPKKGEHSVGVANQYCGVMGKNANCQVTVSVSLANQVGSLPAAYRLYLPEDWANDPLRRKKAGVPESLTFAPKWKLALELITGLLAQELPPAPVVADAGFGDVMAFRKGLTALKLKYTVGIAYTTTVWPPGQQPLPPAPHSGRGRPSKVLRRTAEHKPVTARELALSVDPSAWVNVTWRQGTQGPMTSRFVRLLIRPAHRDYHRSEPWPEEWLLIEWPESEPEPTRYWLSTEDLAFQGHVHSAKERWHIERDYQELKTEFGLDKYQGRGWRGFHHHWTLCVAAYAFTIAERARLSPPGVGSIHPIQASPLPEGFRPRGAPSPGRTPSTSVHHDLHGPACPGDTTIAALLSLLSKTRCAHPGTIPPTTQEPQTAATND